MIQAGIGGFVRLPSAAVLRGRFAVYGAVSALYLLNLEAVLRWRGLPEHVLRPRPIAAALLVAFAVALAGLWQRCRRSQEGSQLERRAA